MGEHFKLQINASKLRAGAVLVQTGYDGFDHPVRYFSRKFNSYHLNDSIVKTHFEVYVGGGVGPPLLRIDHNALMRLLSLQNQNQWLMR